MKKIKEGLRKGLGRLFIFLITCSILISFSGAVSASQITVDTNRYVVLDDPNTGIAGTGFFNPSAVRGGSWNSNLWSGESTTIRAVAVVTDNTGSPLSGATVTFRLRNPGGTVNTTTIASSPTNSKGIAYYSFNMNAMNYWGNWKLEANATIGGNNIQNSTSFTSNWWGCAQCHNNKVGSSTLTGKFGSYTAKSYYTMGATFHSRSLHSAHINAMTSGACIVCHQSYNGTAKNWGFSSDDPSIPTHKEYSPDWHNNKVACQDCHDGSNSSAVGGSENQAKNPDIAGCYDTAGCHPKDNANLKEVNSTTGYVVGGNYRATYSDVQNTNVAKAHNDTRVECIACHGAGHNISKPYNALASSNANTENEQCWACHTKRTGTHFGETCTSCHSQDAHNVSASGGSGPDCKSCHDIGSGAPAHVNFTVANSTGSIHSNLNYQTVATVDAGNKKCWACHGNGSQPTEHPSNYKTPYRCEDCHVTIHNLDINCNVCHDMHGGGVGAVIPYVQQHKQAGISINTTVSCYQCHNRSEMLQTVTDPDTGTVYGGTNGGVNSPSHYGKKRTDMGAAGSNSYCSYCHNDSVNGATFYVGEKSGNIVNHSSSTNTPLCSNCHGLGRIHDDLLNKASSSDDAYCRACHADKNEHKTVRCTECHANNSDRSQAGKDIHGIKFLQTDNTFSTGRTNAVDCTTCHQKNTVDSSIGAPPKVNDPLHHSNDVINGSKWGNYWTGTNPITACVYCHNDTKHDLNPLGRPLVWNSSYVLNTPIGGGTNCDDCHYTGDSNYAAMNSAFTGSGLEVPPEISSGGWNGKPGYFNHSFSDYSDAKCKQCHDSGGSSTVGEMTHRATIGGGEDCIACHNSANPASSLVVDINVFNNSIHQNINNTPIDTVNNNDCWSCHFNIDMNRQNVRKCNYCHSKPSQWHGNANVTINLMNLSIR